MPSNFCDVIYVVKFANGTRLPVSVLFNLCGVIYAVKFANGVFLFDLCDVIYVIMVTGTL